MSQVTVVCKNPDDIKLEVSVEFSIAIWKEILRRTQENHTRTYYAPFDEWLDAIEKGVKAIESREDVKFMTGVAL